MRVVDALPMSAPFSHPAALLLDPADTIVSLRTLAKATEALEATFHLVI